MAQISSWLDVGAQIQWHRTQLGWNQTRLAEECSAAGLRNWDRSVVTNIEIGRRRRVGVDELLIVALVLGVPPILLIVPLGRAESVQVAPNLATDPDDARRWVQGDLSPAALGWRGAIEATDHWAEAAQLIDRFREQLAAAREQAESARAEYERAEGVGDEAKRQAKKACRTAFERYARLTAAMQEDDIHPPDFPKRSFRFMTKLDFDIPAFLLLGESNPDTNEA